MAKKLQKSLDFSAFFNNLIDVCDGKNISVTTLIDKFASSRSAMTAWKNGTINADIIPKLALELNVSLDYLLTGKEKSSSLPNDEQELLSYYKKLPEREKQRLIGRASALAELYEEQIIVENRVNTISIHCSDNRVSAGIGDELYDYEQWGTINIVETKESRKADFMLKVDGNSMEPKFYDEDYVLIRQQPAVDIVR